MSFFSESFIENSARKHYPFSPYCFLLLKLHNSDNFNKMNESNAYVYGDVKSIYIFCQKMILEVANPTFIISFFSMHNL